MTITAASLAGGSNADNTTSNARSVGTVTAGQMVVVCGMKYSPTIDAFIAGDCTKTAGTSTIGSVTLDRTNGGAPDGTADCHHAGIWSFLVTGSGSLTVTIGGALAGSYILNSAEAFNGSWDASRVEAVNGQLVTTDSGVTAGSGNVTTAGAGLLVGALAISATGVITITPDAAFTQIYESQAGDTTEAGSAIYRIVSSGTTDAADWAIQSDNTGYAACVVAYKEVSAASTITAATAPGGLSAMGGGQSRAGNPSGLSSMG